MSRVHIAPPSRAPVGGVVSLPSEDEPAFGTPNLSVGLQKVWTRTPPAASKRVTSDRHLHRRSGSCADGYRPHSLAGRLVGPEISRPNRSGVVGAKQASPPLSPSMLARSLFVAAA